MEHTWFNGTFSVSMATSCNVCIGVTVRSLFLSGARRKVIWDFECRFIINPRLISSLLAKMLKELFKTFSHYSALHHTRWTRCSVEENVPVLMI